MDNKTYFLIMALLVFALITGIVVGTKISGESDCTPLREEFNSIIKQCNQALLSTTQCETKFVCVECGGEVCS